MKIMVTGHRDIQSYDQLYNFFYSRLKPGHTYISGMALGTDIAFAEAIRDRRLPLIAAVPNINQAAKWKAQDQLLYSNLLDYARECGQVVQVDLLEKYKSKTYVQSLFARNRWMVDQSEFAIVIWDGRKSGGTYHALQLIQKKAISGVIINPNTFEEKRF